MDSFSAYCRWVESSFCLSTDVNSFNTAILKIELLMFFIIFIRAKFSSYGHGLVIVFKTVEADLYCRHLEKATSYLISYWRLCHKIYVDEKHYCTYSKCDWFAEAELAVPTSSTIQWIALNRCSLWNLFCFWVNSGSRSIDNDLWNCLY